MQTTRASDNLPEALAIDTGGEIGTAASCENWMADCVNWRFKRYHPLAFQTIPFFCWCFDRAVVVPFDLLFFGFRAGWRFGIVWFFSDFSRR